MKRIILIITAILLCLSTYAQVIPVKVVAGSRRPADTTEVLSNFLADSSAKFLMLANASSYSVLAADQYGFLFNRYLSTVAVSGNYMDLSNKLDTTSLSNRINQSPPLYNFDLSNWNNKVYKNDNTLKQTMSPNVDSIHGFIMAKGYLWCVGRPSFHSGRLIRINPNNLTDTVSIRLVGLKDTFNYYGHPQITYVASQNKLYIDCSNAISDTIVILAVNPDSFSSSYHAYTAIKKPQFITTPSTSYNKCFATASCTDGIYLYTLVGYYDPYIYKFNLNTNQAIDSVRIMYKGYGHNILFDGTNLFATSANSIGISSPYTWAGKFSTSPMSILSIYTTTDATQGYTDDACSLGGFYYAALEQKGVLRRFNKIDMSFKDYYLGVGAPVGMATDGRYVYIAVCQSGGFNGVDSCLYRFDPQDQTILRHRFKDGNNNPNEIVSDGTQLWISNFTGPQILTRINAIPFEDTGTFNQIYNHNFKEFWKDTIYINGNRVLTVLDTPTATKLDSMTGRFANNFDFASWNSLPLKNDNKLLQTMAPGVDTLHGFIMARGYIWGVGRSTYITNRLVRINPENLTDTVSIAIPEPPMSVPGVPNYRGNSQITYVASKDRLYIDMCNSVNDTVRVLEVNPNGFSSSSTCSLVINKPQFITTPNSAYNKAYLSQSCTDGTYLYTLGGYYDPYIYKFELNTYTCVDSVRIMYKGLGHAIMFDGTYLYAGNSSVQSVSNPVSWFVKVQTSPMAILNTMTISGDVTQGYTNQMVSLGEYVYAGNELYGSIRRFKKADLSYTDFYCGLGIMNGISTDGKYIYGFSGPSSALTFWGYTATNGDDSCIYRFDPATMTIARHRFPAGEAYPLSMVSDGSRYWINYWGGPERISRYASISFEDTIKYMKPISFNQPPQIFGLTTGTVGDSVITTVNGVLYKVLKNGYIISTPTNGQTVNLTNNYYNVINPSSSLSTLTVTFPSTPADKSIVEFKFEQSITTVTYSGGTFITNTSMTSPGAGQYIKLTYNASNTTWY